MLLLAGLAPLVVLVAGVVTGPSPPSYPFLTVPITKHVDFNGMSDFIKRDRGHLRNLVKRGGHRRQSSTGNKVADILLNNTGSGYVATVSVGNPPTSYRLLVDSRSSFTWVGANKAYVETKNSVKTKDTVNITYSTGFFTGPLYNDTVTISEGFTVPQQYIGVASNSSGFSPLDGVLGVGPNDLTLGALNPDTNMIARTVTDNLFHQGSIQKNQVAVSFEPTTSFPTVNGELIFGGDDPTKYTGILNCFPLSDSAPANTYWSFDAAIQHGNTTILTRAPGVFDTGNPLFGLATDAYKFYVERTGAIFDDTTKLLRISPDQYENLQSLYFNFEHRTYEFNANAQIWPRALNHHIGGDNDHIYLIVYDLGPQEKGFCAGMAFLERYAVFDSRRHRVCLANTQFTNSTTIN